MAAASGFCPASGGCGAAAHIEANRALVHHRRLANVREIVAQRGPITAYDVVPLLDGEPITALNASWWLADTLCYLRHLGVTGVLARDGGEPERWVAAGGV